MKIVRGDITGDKWLMNWLGVTKISDTFKNGRPVFRNKQRNTEFSGDKMRTDIIIERDSALRGILFSSEKPLAYDREGEYKPICELLIPDRTMIFLEDYFKKVIDGKSKRWWPKP